MKLSASRITSANVTGKERLGYFSMPCSAQYR